MTTLAKRGSGTPTTNGTTWATTTNAVDGTVGTNPATYTTYTNATASAVGYIEISGYDFSSTVGASDTLNSVTVNLRHFENNTGRFASVRFQPYDGVTAIGTIFTATLATGARNDSTTFPVTLAQLRSSTFKIRVTITGAASTQSRVESIDYVDVTADYTITPPTITQAAYRWFDDGTETGSVALAAQDTAATGDVTLQDGIGQLRVRLQSTTAVDVGATDDFQLQYEKNTSGIWTSPGASEAALGSNIVAACTGAASLNISGRTGVGQSFKGNGRNLTSAVFWLSKGGTPAATTVTAYLYAHTGTYGDPLTGKGTGSVLATSTNTVAVTSLDTVNPPTTKYTFNFDGSFTLSDGTPYVMLVDGGVGGDASNYVRAGSATGLVAGNASYLAAGVWTSTSVDVAAEVYTTPGTVLGYNSASLTDGAATTNRLTGGSGSFVAGKVSETGLATDVGWSGNNYTELVYSIDIVNTDVANGDTLRFRVLRNGLTIGLTYTQTPTINIVKAAATITGASAVSITFDISTVGTVISGTPALYSDDFDRANATLTTPWVNVDGTHSVVSNQVPVGSSSPNVSRYDQPVNADQWVEADLSGLVESGSTISLCLRVNGANLYYIWRNAANVGIFRRVGGVYDLVAEGSAVGSAFKARLEAEGTTLRAYVNDILNVTTTDSNIATGQLGIISADGSAAVLDNWRGGDLPYVPLSGTIVTGTAALAVTVNVVVQGTVVAEIVTGTAVLAITFNVVTQGTVIAEIVTGTVALALNVSVIAQGTVIAEVVTGQAAVQIGVNVVVQGTVIAEIVTGTAVIPISISSTTVGTRIVYGVSALNIGIISSTTGTIVGAVTGVSALQLTISSTTIGTRIVTGTSVLQLVVSSTTIGTSFKIVTGAAVIPITVSSTITGIRIVSGVSVIPIGISSTTTGTRIVHGTSALNLSVVTAATGTVVAEVVSGTSTLNVVVQVVAIGTVVGQAPVVTGTSVVTINLVSTTIGTRIVRGASIFVLNLVSIATGTRIVSGASVKTLMISVNAVGQLIVTGVSSLTIPIDITVIGQKVGALNDVSGMWGELEFVEMQYESTKVVDWSYS